MIKKIRLFAATHKVISTLVVVILLVGAYYSYKSATATPAVTKYIIQKATQGTVIASVSGSGQAEAGTTISISPKVSEVVTKIAVSVGAHVSAGQLLVQLDPSNEQKAVQSAQLSLESAQLNLQKLQQTSTSTLLSDQDAVTKDQQSIITASATLAADYQTGFNDLGGTFINLQNVISGLENFVAGNNVNKAQSNPDAYVGLMPSYLEPAAIVYRNNIQSTYQAAAAAYQANLSAYHSVTQSSDRPTLDALFSQTYTTAKAISDAVKASKDFLDYVTSNYPASSSTGSLPAITTTFQTSMGGYLTTINGEVTNVQNTITSITNDQTSIINSQSALKQANEALAELIAGPAQTDVLSQQISIQSAQNNLDTAEQNLADTSIRAPIDGIVSSIAAVVGQTVPSSAVSIVGNGEDAAISLNEVDAAKIALGDKATLTFDAISGLSLAGQIIEIDPVGTVSQGVVSYNVKIGFTDVSGQVKPGMSIAANIISQVRQDVIAVPNAAVKSQGSNKYILEPATAVDDGTINSSTNGGVVLAGGVKMVPVTVGISNSTLTEIVSGVSVGDQIIVQAITSSGSTTSGATTAGTSGLRLGGNGLFGGGGGGGVRVGAGG